MNITTGFYLFHSNKIVIQEPTEIIVETEKCYFTKHGRYLKSEIGVPILKSRTTYPYIEVVMVDANEGELKYKLGNWFSDKAKWIEDCIVNKER